MEITLGDNAFKMQTTQIAPMPTAGGTMTTEEITILEITDTETIILTTMNCTKVMPEMTMTTEMTAIHNKMTIIAANHVMDHNPLMISSMLTVPQMKTPASMTCNGSM